MAARAMSPLAKRMIYDTMRRATRENILVLGSFARLRVPEMREPELTAFSKVPPRRPPPVPAPRRLTPTQLLAYEDPDLYIWLTVDPAPTTTPAVLADCPIFREVRSFAQDLCRLPIEDQVRS